ncbi:LysR family transcriptional regulator [Jeotgalicoccus coquinae]|uniref:DNA-binding transcriptional LysR family regulator n=1 Tax=Jeotgalicoccus coquinae TaxID=709509 RepID=A0A6V7R2G2_9STAP|nr:LysR family transcriptional regulator [Jeotgalicoccus coquinae]MBB6423518.1 DNA-binding transcriptional LysR family regulator [Jeotgalicoccus coquinae]GGE20439.1 LysR family transcriptional regulator [Jeotgalicoccus coquinae]CAD2071539.1 HTH-type transcriptional regulator TfdS [Jeotgalicoccus coquinae]
MTLQQLKYLIAVVNSGSINEAAKNLYISQPTLSKAIKELEREMGITILKRTSTGIVLSPDGAEFLSYARQITEQVELLENKYLDMPYQEQLLSVSTQHYSFSVDAMVRMIRLHGGDKYQFSLRETRTYEIIDDVKNLKSEIGVMYMNNFNEKILTQLLKENHLNFELLFTAKPHVFISKTNPLAQKDKVTLEDLEPYPRLSFDQGEHSSFYFSEEILSTLHSPKNILVSDRATIFNCMIGLNGYTISSGILSEELNGTDIIPVPLDVNDEIKVGTVTNNKARLSRVAKLYLKELVKTIESYNLI